MVTRELAKGPGSPEIIVLRDNLVGVEAAIAPSQGGELSSYRVRFRGEWVELLFHARDYSPGPGFKGKAPLLWPAVGAQYPVGTNPKTSCGDGTYPIAWINTHGKGRCFYCSLGHREEIYWNPTVLKHYLAGIQYALGDLEADATPSK